MCGRADSTHAYTYRGFVEARIRIRGRLGAFGLKLKPRTTHGAVLDLSVPAATAFVEFSRTWMYLEEVKSFVI